MSRAYADLAFTPAVRAKQNEMGSRRAYAAMDADDVARDDRLGRHEADFIEARDSFYQATVGENGWPYVQHRGGRPGFLKALDAQTVAYADYRGNRQYISAGHLQGNDRVSLILVDYAHQRRLKLLGRARLVDAAQDPALLARLNQPGKGTRVERAVVITIEAFDWNCPQHITPRFTEAEIDRAVEPLRQELSLLRARLAGFEAATSTGTGSPP